MSMDISSLSGPGDVSQALSLGETKLPTSSEASKSEQAAKDFESVLLHKLLTEMAKTVDESPLMDSSASRGAKDMFWYYLAQDLADKGGLGLWKQISGRQQYATAALQGKKVNE